MSKDLNTKKKQTNKQKPKNRWGWGWGWLPRGGQTLRKELILDLDAPATA